MRRWSLVMLLLAFPSLAEAQIIVTVSPGVELPEAVKPGQPPLDGIQKIEPVIDPALTYPLPRLTYLAKPGDKAVEVHFKLLSVRRRSRGFDRKFLVCGVWPPLVVEDKVRVTRSGKWYTKDTDIRYVRYGFRFSLFGP